MADIAPPVLRSRRATTDAAGEVLTPLKQVRVPTNGVTFGAWCYYARPDGETIRDVLVLSPNGGNAPDNPDPRIRAKYGTNASYYHDRAEAKGFITLGPKLTTEAVRTIVDILLKNREEAVLYCQDQLALCEYTIATTGVEKDRQIAHKRKAQFQKRLDTVLQPFNPDELVAEMEEIARAQRMSRMDPATRQAVAEMIGERVNAKFEEMVNHFAKGGGTGDEELQGVKVTRGGAKKSESIFDD